MSLLEEFENPGPLFRAAPFWAWNDKLEPEELRRQVREHAAQGCGGYFMHSRIGLVNDYMSEDWMQCIAACLEEGKHAGIHSWLYDEDCWPSGNFGFVLPDMGPEYQQKHLALVVARAEELANNPALLDNALKIFLADGIEGAQVTGLEDATGREITAATLGGRVALGFVMRHWPNYIDTLSKEVVRKFIELQYEPYAERFGQDFGKAIPGIFTDEPAYNYVMGEVVPWTDDFPGEFEARAGYDLLPHLPALFLDLPGHEKVRLDFRRVATALYVEAFSQQIGEWCQAHKLVFTGHQVAEDTLASQTLYIGDAMAHYEYMQLPGIDHLTRRIAAPLLVKQLSSVAHQLGKERTLSETYGCSGWNASFEELKRIGDWQTVLGVNLFCQHLELYSMRGSRKRDYPPSLYYQQPYWEDYKPFMDYQARANYVMSQGKFSADVLLLHPIESAWCAATPRDMSRVAELDRSLEAVSTWLLELQYDYDLGSEAQLAKYGSVEKGLLNLGQMSYKVVVAPPCYSLRASTVALLEAFMDAGGKVIVIHPEPWLVDGEPEASLEAFVRRADLIELNRDELIGALAKAVAPQIVLSDASGNPAPDVFVHHRLLAEANHEVWMLTNLSEQRGYQLRVRLASVGHITELCLEEGCQRPVSARESHGETLFSTDLAPCQSRVFLLDLGREPQITATNRLLRAESLRLGPDWTLRLGESNALTLDCARASLEGGDWSERRPVLWTSMELQGAGVERDVRLLFDFECGKDPATMRELLLVLEQPERYRITCNGQEVVKADLGWWKDISFRKLDLKPYARQGANELELAIRFLPGFEQHDPAHKRPNYHYTPKTELEAVYIVGNFGARQVTESSFRLVDTPAKASTGDLVWQGLPFYSGAVTYTTTFAWQGLAPRQRLVLELPDVDAIVVKARVNGQEAGALYWRPYTLDITEFLQVGDNTLELTCVGSNRNLLGPHHHPAGELLGVDPTAFTGQPGWLSGPERPWVWSYNFVPFGLTSPPELVLYELV